MRVRGTPPVLLDAPHFVQRPCEGADPANTPHPPATPTCVGPAGSMGFFFLMRILYRESTLEV